MDELSSYPLAKEHYADGVSKRPLALWNWGMEKRTGSLGEILPSRLRQKLLPRVEVKVRREGISFEGLNFTNGRLYDEDRFTKAGVANFDTLEMAYDPRCVARTYLVPEDIESELEPLELTSAWSGRGYETLSWREVQVLRRKDKAQSVESTIDDQNRHLNTRRYQEEIQQRARASFERNRSREDVYADFGNAMDHIRQLELDYNGVANVPSSPPAPQLIWSSPQAAAEPEADDERTRIAKQLLQEQQMCMSSS